MAHHLPIRAVFLIVFSSALGGPAASHNFVWDRTQTNLGATSTATVQLQGGAPVVSMVARTNQAGVDEVQSEAELDLLLTAPGGGGGEWWRRWRGAD